MGQEHVSIISPAVPIKPTSNIPAYPIYGGAPVHPTAYSYTLRRQMALLSYSTVAELNRHTAKIIGNPEFMNRPDSPNLMGQEHVSIISPAVLRNGHNVPMYPLSGGSCASNSIQL